MSALLVQSRSAQTSSAATSLALAFSSNVTAGNALIVGGGAWTLAFGAQSAAQAGICSDTLVPSSSYSRAGNESANTNAHAGLYYALNVAGGACTVTLAPTGGTQDITILLTEWSGLGPFSLLDVAKPAGGDATTVGTGTSDAGGTHTSGTTTAVAGAGELLVAVFASEGSTSTFTAGSGYTSPASLQQTSSAHLPACMEYNPSAGSGGQVATANWPATAAYASVIAAFLLATPLGPQGGVAANPTSLAKTRTASLL